MSTPIHDTRIGPTGEPFPEPVDTRPRPEDGPQPDQDRNPETELPDQTEEDGR
jgi:hypothetical protein